MLIDAIILSPVVIMSVLEGQHIQHAGAAIDSLDTPEDRPEPRRHERALLLPAAEVCTLYLLDHRFLRPIPDVAPIPTARAGIPRRTRHSAAPSDDGPQVFGPP